MRRRSAVFPVLGSILLLGAIVAGLINRSVLDGDRFAAGIDDVRREPAVARQIGAAIAARLFTVTPDLIAVRPLVEAAATTLAGSGALTPVVRAAAREAHRAFTDDSHGQVALRLVDVGAALTGALTVIAPDVAARLPAQLDVSLAQVGSQSFAARTIHLTWVIGVLSWVLPVLALLSLAAGWWLCDDWVQRTARTGWAIAAAGAGVGIAAAGGTIAISFVQQDTLHGALIGGLWRHFGRMLWWPAAIAVSAGLLLVTASRGRLPHRDVADIVRRGWTQVGRRPSGRGARVARGAGLVVLGGCALLRPGFVFRTLGALTGLLIVIAGVSEIGAAVEGQPGRRNRSRPRVRQGIASALGVALVLALLGLGALPVDSAVTSVVQTAACNGHVELCSRRYNDVAFPATHNAMAAADEPGWFIPEQPTGLVGQLNAGIRVLLVDTWYGQRTRRPGLIATAAGSHAKALAAADAEFGPQVVASALRVRDAVTTTPTGPIQPYLCHGLCEIGATKWEPVMAQVRSWLTAHPREVVTFFVEDYVSPADTAAVFARAGLLPYVHTQEPATPWPTLGQMIASGRRVVVLMENHGGGRAYPWMLQGFDWVQDTPYTNPNPTALSCVRKRGNASSPLFLVNYWLSNFQSLVTDSRRINRFSVLWPHLTECRTQRGQLPNFVAVNYYNEGDLFRAVDDLNGVA